MAAEVHVVHHGDPEPHGVGWELVGVRVSGQPISTSLEHPTISTSLEHPKYRCSNEVLILATKAF